MAPERKRQVLGKGLGALIPGGEEGAEGELLHLALGEIFPNPDQPRRSFDPATLSDLANSIKEKGILQPILVHRVPGGYELVVGERRLRAARMAGLAKVPAVVRKVARSESLEDALVENLQREDLNPLEEASGYREMQEKYKLTQDEIARRVGKDRTTVTNALRLLSLPEFVREELVRGTLTAGHARALLALGSPREMRVVLGKVLSRGLSVRETERAVARSKSAREKAPPGKETPPEIAAVIRRLERHFGTAVRIRSGRKGGRIEILYHSVDELNGVLDKILGRKDGGRS